MSGVNGVGVGVGVASEGGGKGVVVVAVNIVCGRCGGGVGSISFRWFVVGIWLGGVGACVILPLLMAVLLVMLDCLGCC